MDFVKKNNSRREELKTGGFLFSCWMCTLSGRCGWKTLITGAPNSSLLRLQLGSQLTDYSHQSCCAGPLTLSGQRTFFSTSDTERSEEEEETRGRRFLTCFSFIVAKLTSSLELGPPVRPVNVTSCNSTRESSWSEWKQLLFKVWLWLFLMAWNYLALI